MAVPAHRATRSAARGRGKPVEQVTLTDAHIEAAGRALKVLADSGIGLGDAQLCLTLMMTYMSLKFEWNVDELLRHMQLNIQGVGSNPQLMKRIIQGMHREIEHNKIVVPVSVQLERAKRERMN
jgi:hypothetical protein